MAYDEQLAERIRKCFREIPKSTENKMFGGIAFMVVGNLCCGIVKDSLMARVGPVQYAASLKMKHVGEMKFTGKPMVGMVYVAPEGIKTNAALDAWIQRCLAFVRSLPEKKK